MSLCDENTRSHHTPDIGHYVSQPVVHFYDAVKQALETRRLYAERRDAFKTLLRLDAAALKDIGLSRDDIVWASKLPLHVNASLELQKIRNHMKSNR